MSKSRWKSFLLVFLIGLSIYQTGRLWFEDLSNRNFFYSVFLSKIKENKRLQSSKQNIVIRPKQVVVSFADGEEEFTVVSNTRGESTHFQQVANTILKKALQKGNYIETIDLEELEEDPSSIIWEYPGVILGYYVDIPFSSFIGGLGLKPVSYGKQIGLFEQIWILAHEQAQKIQYEIYFMESQERIAHHIQWVEEKGDGFFINQIKELRNKQFWTYSASKKDGLSKFARNVFLPTKTEEVYVNQVLFLKNPFLEEEKVNEELLEETLNPFFENHALKWMIKKEDNQYVYGDDRIIIKYFPQGIIEYSNQVMSSSSKEMSLEEAYQVAEQFLLKDKQLTKQEYELVSYEKQENQYQFFFNYSFYDFPYIISDRMKEQIQLQYPIEIGVENYQVKFYRRWVLEQKDLPIYLREMQDTYIEAYDRLAGYLTETQKQEPIQDLFLAYYQENRGDNPQLSWVFHIGDEWYYERAR